MIASLKDPSSACRLRVIQADGIASCSKLSKIAYPGLAHTTYMLVLRSGTVVCTFACCPWCTTLLLPHGSPGIVLPAQRHIRSAN